MSEVARCAGVGVGTVYRHFPSRQHVLEAVFTDEVDQVCAQARPLPGSSVGESLTTWLHEFFGFELDRDDVAVELNARGQAAADHDRPVVDAPPRGLRVFR